MADTTAATRSAGTLFVAVPLVAFLGGLWLMLLLGIVHLNVSTSVPALGYWTCVPLVLLARMVASSVFRSTAPQRVTVEPGTTPQRVTIEATSEVVNAESIARVVNRANRDLSRR